MATTRYLIVEPTSMADISSAQAVLLSQARLRCLHEWGSVNDPPCHPSDPGWKGCSTCAYKPGLAAAIEELADQVVPKEWPTIEDYNEYDQGVAAAHIKCRNQLLAIAAELRGDTTTTETP